MALNLGRLAAGAGVVGSSWRKEEEAQRVARQNQLKIEEQNRLNRFRQNELGATLPETPATPPAVGYEQYIDQFPVETAQVETAPVAAPQAPVVPVAGTQTAQNVQQYPNWKPVPIVPARPTMDPKEIERMKALVPMGPVDRAVVAGLRGVQGFIAPDTLPPMAYRANAGKAIWTPAATVDAKPTMPLSEIDRMREITGGKKSTRGKTQAEQVAAKTKEELAPRKYALPTQAEIVPAAPVAVNPEVQTYFAALEQQNGIPQGVLAAIMQQESGGRAGLTSKAGAQGYFQFMPDTAKQYGVKVNDFNSESQGAAKLVGDLYRKYNGDMTKVLAAYNWGQGNVDREGLAKAPKETRDYIAKVGAAIPAAQTQVQAQAQPPVSIVPPVSAKVGELPTPKEQRKITDFYLANPNAVNEDTAKALRQRDELVRLAKSYQSAGMGLEFTNVRAKIMELDESMYYLQGMQSLNELSVANDPRRLSAVWSRAIGQPVGIQPRTDGTFNVFLNGNKLDKTYTANELASQARSAFDAGYVKQVNELAIGQNSKLFESQLKQAEENGKQLAQMIREIAVENVKGVNTLNVEKLKGMNYDVKPTGRGDGTVIVTPPFGGTPYFYNPEGKTIEVDGVKITSNAAYPIAGLPSISGLPQIAKR